MAVELNAKAHRGLGTMLTSIGALIFTKSNCPGQVFGTRRHLMSCISLCAARTSLHIIKHDLQSRAYTAGKRTGSSGHVIVVQGARGKNVGKVHDLKYSTSSWPQSLQTCGSL